MYRSVFCKVEDAERGMRKQEGSWVKGCQGEMSPVDVGAALLWEARGGAHEETSG